MGVCISTNLNAFGPDEQGQATRIAHQAAEREMKEVGTHFVHFASHLPWPGVQSPSSTIGGL